MVKLDKLTEMCFSVNFLRIYVLKVTLPFFFLSIQITYIHIVWVLLRELESRLDMVLR